ncbi:MAG: hypothetical protein ACRD2G_08875 [Terriglobia bacterium]
MICAVCCGTGREVTIDCPSDCIYLIASREHHDDRREVDWEKMPFASQKISYSVLEAHEPLFMRLLYVICEFASEYRPLVDSDIQAVYQALAETYQTLTNGILYESPPAYLLQRELYGKLRHEVEEYKKQGPTGISAQISVRDSEIRDVLILTTQIAAGKSNGRPKGRAFLDFMRSQFKPGTFARQESKIILAP